MVRFRKSILVECLGDTQQSNRLATIRVEGTITLKFEYLMDFDEFMQIKMKVDDINGKIRRTK